MLPPSLLFPLCLLKCAFWSQQLVMRSTGWEADGLEKWNRWGAWNAQSSLRFCFVFFFFHSFWKIFCFVFSLQNQFKKTTIQKCITRKLEFPVIPSSFQEKKKKIPINSLGVLCSVQTKMRWHQTFYSANLPFFFPLAIFLGDIYFFMSEHRSASSFFMGQLNKFWACLSYQERLAQEGQLHCSL